MESINARISARSRRQAMDWSLVLVSQGIATSIEFSPESGWELAISTAEYERALEVLRQYQLENRGWRWRPKFFERDVLFDWGSLAWVVLICAFYLLSEQARQLIDIGSMDSAAVLRGQWWRLFTAIWLHADLAHLAGNATLGLVLLGLCMGRFGTGVGLLGAYLAGIGGNIISGVFSVEPHHSLGASGMVMGCLGLLAGRSFRQWRQTIWPKKYIIAQLTAGFLLFLLLGLAPGTDILAHLGGFIAGLLLGHLLLLSSAARLTQRNLLGGALFAILVIYPWWIALHQMH